MHFYIFIFIYRLSILNLLLLRIIMPSWLKFLLLNSYGCNDSFRLKSEPLIPLKKKIKKLMRRGKKLIPKASTIYRRLML